MRGDADLTAYIDIRIDDLRRYVDMRCLDIEAAAQREIHVMDGRLEKLNEVREQLAVQYQQFTGQMLLFVPREEYVARHDQMISEVRRIEEMLSGYVTIESSRQLEISLRSLLEWKANLNGRMWAIAIAAAVLQVIIASAWHLVKAG